MSQPLLEGVREQLATYGSAEEVMDKIWCIPEEKRLEILQFWWHWWNNRNRARNKEKSWAPEAVAHRAVIDMVEFKGIVHPE